MSETLTKTLKFPIKEDKYLYGGITATLVAHKMNSYGKRYSPIEVETTYQVPEVIETFIDKNRSDNEFFSWYVHFHLPGPDGRHKSGSAALDPIEFWELHNTILLAYKKMQQLEELKIDSKYSKKFKRRLSNPFVEVKSENGKLQLAFWILSGGQYMYCRHFNIHQVYEMLILFSDVYQQAPELCKQLAVLSD